MYGQVDMINLKEQPSPDLSGYQVVGLASGIYRGRMDRSLFRLVKKGLIDRRSKTFVFYTSGLDDPDAGRSLIQVLENGGYENFGCWHCPGHSQQRRYSSEASKGHPSRQDILTLFSIFRSILRFHLQD
jgi:hypothetical protein